MGLGLRNSYWMASVAFLSIILGVLASEAGESCYTYPVNAKTLKKIGIMKGSDSRTELDIEACLSSAGNYGVAWVEGDKLVLKSGPQYSGLYAVVKAHALEDTDKPMSLSDCREARDTDSEGLWVSYMCTTYDSEMYSDAHYNTMDGRSAQGLERRKVENTSHMVSVKFDRHPFSYASDSGEVIESGAVPVLMAGAFELPLSQDYGAQKCMNLKQLQMANPRFSNGYKTMELFIANTSLEKRQVCHILQSERGMGRLEYFRGEDQALRRRNK